MANRKCIYIIDLNNMAKSVDEIAKMAGVSVTSVRLVISGLDKKYRISEKTRQRIQSIIDEHGYSINQTARNLKLQRTLTLGLVVPHLTNPFFSQFAEKLEICCKESGYQTIVVCSNDIESVEKEITDNLIARGVDGLFVASSSHKRQKTLQETQSKPVVFIDRDFGLADCITTVSDSESAGLQLGKVLPGELLSDIYILTSGNRLPTIASRMSGLIRQLGEAGHAIAEHRVRESSCISKQAGFELMEGLCKELEAPPKAVVTLALPLLEGAMRYLKQEYDRIPAEMLIGSFDHHAMLDFLPNPVFSVRQDAGLLAELAYKQMRALIGMAEPDQIKQVVDVELIRHF